MPLLRAPWVHASHAWKSSCMGRMVPGVAAGTGPWNWVTPVACLRGQLVPRVWADGQVDFSTGIVLPVAIISMCSFVPFPQLIVKKVLGQVVTECVTTSRLWSARSKNFPDPQKY